MNRRMRASGDASRMREGAGNPGADYELESLRPAETLIVSRFLEAWSTTPLAEQRKLLRRYCHEHPRFAVILRREAAELARAEEAESANR
ncbi:MAG: hypothetical protein H6832_02980 [Planctomycetes bacterium]|nr:hypothetical protein [Planctomycetota bacterium]MCB9917346.1 hypothetical protein [Planctomycetota bacterium]